MRVLQPVEWTKPRGFSHGVAFDAPGRWIVLAGQTGGDEKGEYQSDMAGQVAVALRRIVKLLSEAGAGPRASFALPGTSPAAANTRPLAQVSVQPGARRWDEISRLRRCSISQGLSMSARKSRSKSPRSCRPSGLRYNWWSPGRMSSQVANRSCPTSEGRLSMAKRSTSADFVTAFATGWPENQPEIMVLSLTTHKGVQDFALTEQQALLIAKTIKETAARLAKQKQLSRRQEQLAARQRNRRTPEAVLGSDDNGLPVASRAH